MFSMFSRSLYVGMITMLSDVCIFIKGGSKLGTKLSVFYHIRIKLRII